MTNLRNRLIAGAVVAGVVAVVIFSGERGGRKEIRLESLNIQDGVQVIERDEDYFVKKEFVMTGGSLVNKGNLDVSGDFIVGKDAVFENKGTLILSGTGRKLIIPAKYTKRASYSGSIVLVATGTLLTGTKITFYSLLSVDKKSRTIIIPASYGPSYSETGVLLYATGALISSTGSRIEWFHPSLGTVLIR